MVVFKTYLFNKPFCLCTITLTLTLLKICQLITTDNTMGSFKRKYLKRQNQAKIIKKSLSLFWLLSMAIIFEHVHGPELQKSFGLLLQLSKGAESPVYQLFL